MYKAIQAAAAGIAAELAAIEHVQHDGRHHTSASKTHSQPRPIKQYTVPQLLPSIIITIIIINIIIIII